jgi:hypothetical protein
LVCRKWRDLISQIPISFRRLKLELENSEKISTIFNINSLGIGINMISSYPKNIKLLQNCKNLSKFTFFGQEANSILDYIPNPETLTCLKAKSKGKFSYINFPNLEELW